MPELLSRELWCLKTHVPDGRWNTPITVLFTEDDDSLYSLWVPSFSSLASVVLSLSVSGDVFVSLVFITMFYNPGLVSDWVGYFGNDRCQDLCPVPGPLQTHGH